MYAPAIARQIHEENLKRENANFTINLKGLALGNGWVDPHLQTKSYPDYAYHHSLIDLQGNEDMATDRHDRQTEWNVECDFFTYDINAYTLQGRSGWSRSLTIA